MLGKLLKHEYIYLFRTFLPIYIVYAIVTVLLELSMITKLGGILDTDNEVVGYTVAAMFMILMIVYVAMSCALPLLAVFDNIKRFKKNMFSDEGYLTNTLPVTASMHVLGKLIAGLSNFLISAAAVILSLVLLDIGSGEASMGAVLDFVTSDEYFTFPEKFAVLFLGFSIYAAFVTLGYMLCSLNSMTGSKGIVGAAVGFAVIMGVLIAIARILAAFASAADNVDGYIVMETISAFLLLCACGMFFAAAAIIKHGLDLP